MNEPRRRLWTSPLPPGTVAAEGLPTYSGSDEATTRAHAEHLASQPGVESVTLEDGRLVIVETPEVE